MNSGNVLVAGHRGVSSCLTDRSELRAHHGARQGSGGQRRHVADTVGFGECAQSRRGRMTQKGADVGESEERSDLHDSGLGLFVDLEEIESGMDEGMGEGEV